MSNETALVEFDLPVERRAGGLHKRATQRAPWWLWLGALAIIVPVSIAILALFVRALASGGTALDTLLTTRTLALTARSFLLTFLVTASAVAIGVSGAWVLTRTDIRFRSVWAVLFSLPLVIPSYVIAMTFISVGGPRGLLSDAIGVTVIRVTGMAGAWIVLTLSTYPYVFLITSAALVRTDPSLEEAARGLGSSPLRVFRTVVLPQLRPAIGAGALLVSLYTLSDFGAVSLMRVDVFTRAIYAQYSGRIDRTPAITLSIVLMVIAAVVIWAEQRTRGRGVHFSARPTRPPAVLTLTRLKRVSATAFLIVATMLGAGIPMLVLFGWAWQSAAAGDGFFVSWSAVRGSLTGATLAGIIAMAAAIPIVVLGVRYASHRTAWLERSTLFVFSLPHLTVAIAVVAFTVKYARPVYQSLLVLVVVYAALFLAQVTGPARASLIAVNPAVEEASRSLGRGTFLTLARVTIPLMSKGLLAGGALVFVTTLKELPATLLLSPTGFSTLAVRIWAAADEGLYGRAASSALILIAVSVVPMYYLAIRPKDMASR